MATITRRGAGQWQAKVRKKGHPAISETFPTRKEAEDWATDIEAKMRRNVFLDMREAERTTLHDALDRYKREVTCKKKGAAQEYGRIARWQRDTLAVKSLAALTSTDLAAWRDRRLAAGTSPTTVRTDLSLLSALYKTAEREWRLAVINPLRLVTMPRPAEGRKRRLNAAKDEEGRLLAACREIKGGWWLSTFIRLALATAARTGELLALRWQDIDFGNETIRFNETKAGGSRTIPLFDDALVVLNQLRDGIDRVGLIFPGVTQNGNSQAFARACLKAEINNLRAHDLRHEATSRYFEMGLSVAQVAAITGHKTAQVLLGYTHPRPVDILLNVREFQRQKKIQHGPP